MSYTLAPCASCEVTCLEYHSSNFFFKKLLRKITTSLEILLQMEIWTWKKLAGGGGVNDETEDVLVIDGEGGDEDDDAIDYIHSDEAVVSKVAVDEQ